MSLDADLQHAGAPDPLGFLKGCNQFEKLGFTAMVKFYERDSDSPVVQVNMAHRAQRAKVDPAGVDAHVDERIDREGGKVGHLEQAAARAQI